MMNVYEISIWRGVKHNGEFSHNVQRMELIHARNEAEARGKVTLTPSKTYESNSSLKIEASAETIYSCRKTGTVLVKPFYVYSDGRTPRPTGRNK